MDKLLQVFVLTDTVSAVVLKKKRRLLKELCHHIYLSDAKSYLFYIRMDVK